MNKNFFLQGIQDVLPMLIPVVPFGLIYGVLGLELGFDPFVIIASSFIIFGGASQLAFIQLYSIGASPFIALSSVAAVNSTFALWSCFFTIL